MRSYEVGSSGRASVTALADWLQESAGNHVTALGWAVDQLAEHGLTWVLARLHLRVERLPAWREQLRVATWPSGVQRLFALREFRVSDGEGLEVAAATSGWLLIDARSHRPNRLPAVIDGIARGTPERVIRDEFGRLPALDQAEFERTFEVRFSDLDLNGHANNAGVLSWALDGLPAETLERSSLRELEIEYRAEALLGDRVVARSGRLPGEGAAVLHSLVRAADDREIARARTAWRSGHDAAAHRSRGGR